MTCRFRQRRNTAPPLCLCCLPLRGATAAVYAVMLCLLALTPAVHAQQFDYIHTNSTFAGGNPITGHYAGGLLLATDNNYGVYNGLTFDMSGASAGGEVIAYCDSTVNVYSGTYGGLCKTGSAGTLNFYGGSTAGMIIYTSASLYGGAVTDTFMAQAAATVNVYGGAFHDLQVQGTSVVDMRGGNITGEIDVIENATLNLHGTGLSVASSTPATFYQNNEFIGNKIMLAGTLSDGTSMVGKVIYVSQQASDGRPFRGTLNLIADQPPTPALMSRAPKESPDAAAKEQAAKPKARRKK